MKAKLITLLSASAISVCGLASADDAKTFPGAMCSYMYDATAAYSKDSQVFRNTSGGSEWVTCPMVRDVMTGKIEYARLVTSWSGPSNVRLEAIRDGDTGVVGWGPDSNTTQGGVLRRFEWFIGSSQGASYNYAGYSIQCYLGDDEYVQVYRLTEDT